MVRLLKEKNNRGFTLVELLIVVAIIGVLSTIGIPTFRRMIQKTRKSEAKVNLGGLYTAEQAFFAEYNLFGNNIRAMGFETDGANLIYVVGFPQANCNSLAAFMPLVAGTIGGQTQDAFPQYFLSNAATWQLDAAVAVNGHSVAGVPGQGFCADSTFTPIGAAAAIGTVNAVDVAGESDEFMATATGGIAPGVTPATVAAGTADVWTINQNRELANVQDGVR